MLVAIALGCRDNVGETLSPDDEELWLEYCDLLAETTLEFNRQANAVAQGKGSFEAMKAAYKAVEDTCNTTCHSQFGGSTAD